MKLESHRFCELQRTEDKATIFLRAWIPKEFAIKGRMLGIKMHGEWKGGWKVLNIKTSCQFTDSEKFDDVVFDNTIKRSMNEIS